MTTTPPGPAPGDFELNERTVTLSSGRVVIVREMTLRQRDAVASQLSDLSADEDLQAFAAPFLRQEPGEGASADVEIDFTALVKLASSRLGDGALTRFLATAVLDSPENREAGLFAGEKPDEWALDNLRLRDETALLQAWKECNDLGKYLGNLLGLLSLGASVKKSRAETETETPPGAA